MRLRFHGEDFVYINECEQFYVVKRETKSSIILKCKIRGCLSKIRVKNGVCMFLNSCHKHHAKAQSKLRKLRSLVILDTYVENVKHHLLAGEITVREIFTSLVSTCRDFKLSYKRCAKIIRRKVKKFKKNAERDKIGQ